MRLPGGAEFLVALTLGLAVPACLGAQSLDRFAVVVDNDFLNLWQPVDQRTDHDYTHGTAFSLGYGRNLLFGNRLGTSVLCSPSDSRRCGSSELTLGQKIFTPRRVGSQPVPGERPYAGWLYARLVEEAGKHRFAHRLGVTVGVTGEPSLARAFQELAHNITGFEQPIGWENQLSFEPNFVVSYEYWHLVAKRFIGNKPVLTVFPNVGANLGTVRTSAFGGVTMQVGWNVAHPWGTSSGQRASFSIYATGAVGGELVARDLFLDGNTFSESVSVDHRVAIGRYRLGVAVRLWSLLLSYYATTRGRIYADEPNGHTYSSLRAEIGI